MIYTRTTSREIAAARCLPGAVLVAVGKNDMKISKK